MKEMKLNFIFQDSSCTACQPEQEMAFHLAVGYLIPSIPSGGLLEIVSLRVFSNSFA